VTIATFLCPRVEEQTKRWFEQEPKHRFAALRCPVVEDLETGTATYFAGRWSRGWVYHPYVLGVVRNIILPAVRDSQPEGPHD
jgi:hypothetical protein